MWYKLINKLFYPTFMKITMYLYHKAKDGIQFENAIREREIGNQYFNLLETHSIIFELGNPKFNFLNEIDSSENKYYRWKVGFYTMIQFHILAFVLLIKVYSLCMGDMMDNWREKPFQMSEG